MLTKLLYFTGTGNSLHIAKSLKSHLEKHKDEQVELLPIKEIDRTKSYKIEAHRIGLIYPTYDYDAPKIVKEVVRILDIESEAYVFIYVSSGGGIGNSIGTVQKILKEKGIDAANAFDAMYPDNSVVYQTSPSAKEKFLTQSDEQHKLDSESIFRFERTPDHLHFKIHKGKYLIGKVLELVTINYYGFKSLNADDSCTGCSLCERLCPVNNIKIPDGKPVFEEKCEMCFACLHSCPKQSIKMKRMPKRSNYQYRHPQISLNEIMM